MNINAATASRIAWIMDNNGTEQFSENKSGALRIIIDSIMEQIGKAVLKCEDKLEVPWASSDNSMRQEVEDYLTQKMGYTIEEHFYGGVNDGFVIKW